MEYIIKDGELYHHGVKGQKWGLRRYQNADGSLTLLGKARAGYQKHKKKKTLEKARKAKQEKAEAAKKAKQEQEEFEAGKKKAIESGSAQDVLKYKGKLTQQELQAAFNRLNLERSIADINSRDNANKKSRIEKVTDKLQKAKTLADKGIDMWNVTAKILNSTTDSDLPVIDGTKKKDKAINKAREKLIKSGSVKDIKKNLGSFTTKEIEDLDKRFKFEDNINKRFYADNPRTLADKYHIKKGGAKRDIGNKKASDYKPDDVTAEAIRNFFEETGL